MKARPRIWIPRRLAAAFAKVKSNFVAPGDQPDLIRHIARDAVAFTRA